MEKRILLIKLIEETTNEKENKELDDAMSSGYQSLKAGLTSLKEYKAPKFKKENKLNESLESVIVSGLLAAPKLIEWLGKAINFIARKLSNDENISSGKGIAEFGKKWEKLYIMLLEGAIKLTGFLEDEWKDAKGNINKEKLHLIAKILYGVILGLALATAVKGVLSPGSAVIKAIEVVFGTTKTVEILAITKAVASKFGVKLT